MVLGLSGRIFERNLNSSVGLMQNIIYFFAILVFSTGLFIMLTSDNYVRKIIGLGVLQSSILIFYIALGKVKGGIVPLDVCTEQGLCSSTFTSPLPHVLMLTAIVVGFSTMSVGLALIYQIYKEYNTICESEIVEEEGNL